MFYSMNILLRLFVAVALLMSVFAFDVSAQKGHITLLAVSQGENETDLFGSTADMYLELAPGSGRVFLDTFPLAKVDTQISTRFSKEIACSYVEDIIDCSQYDFIYTIRSGSSIIGGPSAGAASTILTISTLLNEPLDESVAITGTINSGGIVGPVGGVQEKALAAARDGISTVLVPFGESVEFAANKSDLTVIPVGTIEDALPYFLDITIPEKNYTVVVDDEYAAIMKGLSDDLCSRTSTLLDDVERVDDALYDQALNLSKGALAFLKNKSYYSAASYCFGANIRLNYYLLLQEKPDYDEMEFNVEDLSDQVEDLMENIHDLDKKTIPDLEAYMVVIERLIDAQVTLEELEDAFEEGLINDTTINQSYYTYSYAYERYLSAVSWSEFFSKNGNVFDFDQNLRESCVIKISEASERLQYVTLILPTSFEKTQKEVELAQKDLNAGEYELCLFKASKAKAETDLVLSVYGVNQSELPELFAIKSEAVRKVLSKQQSKDVFPILGYSYYEYAQSLQDTDIISALLYLEYALKFSNLDMYFEKVSVGNSEEFSINPLISLFLFNFFFGFFVGMLVMFLIYRRVVKSKTVKKKK